MSFSLAGDGGAIEAANSDFAQAFKARDLWLSLPVLLGIVVVMGALGEWWYGIAFWVLPFLTWFQFVLRVRNIAEHGATEQSDNPFQNVRTTLANPLERLFVAPYWVNYHLEHHMVMHVPCWQLPALHERLLSKGLGAQMRVTCGYRQALIEAGWRTA